MSNTRLKIIIQNYSVDLQSNFTFHQYKNTQRFPQSKIAIIISKMNIQQQLANRELKAKLQSRKQALVKQRLKQRDREKVNLDSTHLKTGKIQKTKFIQKKVFKTEIQKARKVQIKIQDNMNAGTFVGESQQYINILNRTKNYISFKQDKLDEGCKAICAYASSKKEKCVYIDMQMEKDTECHNVPILVKLPHRQQPKLTIIITKNEQQIQTKAINDVNMKILSLKQFSSKYRTDKMFKKEVHRKNNRILTDFKIFSSSLLIKKLLLKNIAIFPLDNKKVPYTIQDEISVYQDYLKLLIQNCIFVAKAGCQHRLTLNCRSSPELSENIKSAIQQTVARLIQKSKVKGNRLIKASIKTETSIPIDIYTN